MEQPPNLTPTIAAMARAFGRSPSSDELAQDLRLAAERLRSAHAVAAAWIGAMLAMLEVTNPDALRSLRTTDPNAASTLRAQFERWQHALHEFQRAVQEDARTARAVLDALAPLAASNDESRAEHAALEHAIARFESSIPDLIDRADEGIDILLVARSCVDSDNDAPAVPYEEARRELGLE